MEGMGDNTPTKYISAYGLTLFWLLLTGMERDDMTLYDDLCTKIVAARMKKDMYTC